MSSLFCHKFRPVILAPKIAHFLYTRVNRFFSKLQIAIILKYRTPQTKAYLDQMTIFLIRLIEALSSSSFQQLLLNTQEFTWSTIQTLGNAQTISAIAETTADICHVLEMEQYYYKQKKRKCIPKAKRCKLRMKRGQRNHIVKSRRTFISGDNDITEVMKSAMGDAHYPSDTQSLNDGRDKIPDQINITSSASAPPTIDDDLHLFIQHRQEQLPDIEDTTTSFWKQLDTSLTQKRDDKISAISNKKGIDQYTPNANTTSALKEDLGLKMLSTLATTPTMSSNKATSKKWIFLFIFILLISGFMFIVSCLGIYGLYSLWNKSNQVTVQQSPQEVVIRVVYENQPKDGQSSKIQSIQIEQSDTSVIAPVFKDILLDN